MRLRVEYHPGSVTAVLVLSLELDCPRVVLLDRKSPETLTRFVPWDLYIATKIHTSWWKLDCRVET